LDLKHIVYDARNHELEILNMELEKENTGKINRIASYEDRIPNIA
jgi:hypothetical protein